MNVRLKTYKKSFDHAYTLGVFPTIELLQFQPAHAIGVLLHTKGKINTGVQKIIALCRQHNIEYQFDDRKVDSLSKKENEYAVGVFEKYQQKLAADHNHVLLVNPSSMGNLGTILRTMLGFGYEDLAIIEPAADIYNPSTVRASMGALFQIQFERFDGIETYIQNFGRKMYLLKSDGEHLLPNTDFETPHTLVFGNESAGLEDRYNRYGQSIRIPQDHRIDSLNLALAVGITLYQAAQYH